MFTGIIQELGIIRQRRVRGGVITLSVQAPKTAAKVIPLESVAIHGVCLTVVTRSADSLMFEMIPETQHLTTLGSLAVGDQVNIEPSLAMTDRLNGHFVFGHVDGLGRIVRRRLVKGELILEVSLPRSLGKFVVAKGPITVDGVSLTVGERPSATSFTIHLIPETLRRTTLRALKVGAHVNLEVDYLAKLVAQQLCRRP